MNSNMQPSVDTSAWYEIEKSLLFDYLVRMTGEVESTTTVLLEVVRVVHDLTKEQLNLNKIRVRLYQTARSFCADRWNKPPEQILPTIYQGTNQGEHLLKIETEINKFEPSHREILLLLHRYAFTPKDIASIMKHKEDKIRSLIVEAEMLFAEKLPNAELKILMQMPLIQLQTEHYTTVALSELFEKNTKNPSLDKRRIVKYLVWLGLIVALLVFYWLQENRLLD